MPHLEKKNTFKKTYKNLDLAGFEPEPLWQRSVVLFNFNSSLDVRNYAILQYFIYFRLSNAPAYGRLGREKLRT